MSTCLWWTPAQILFSSAPQLDLIFLLYLFIQLSSSCLISFAVGFLLRKKRKLLSDYYKTPHTVSHSPTLSPRNYTYTACLLPNYIVMGNIIAAWITGCSQAICCIFALHTSHVEVVLVHDEHKRSRDQGLDRACKRTHDSRFPSMIKLQKL